MLRWREEREREGGRGGGGAGEVGMQYIKIYFLVIQLYSYYLVQKFQMSVFNFIRQLSC